MSSRKRPRTVLSGLVLSTADHDESDRASIQAQAERLGASFRPDPTSPDLTHLICDRAGGLQHRAISRRNTVRASAKLIHILRRSWLTQCEAAGVLVTTDTYALPPLADFVICVSGLGSNEKATLASYAADLGAHYHKSLGQNCTHLLCDTPSGRKYDFARGTPSIRIVRPRWLHECARLNSLVDELPFELSRPEPSESAAPGPLVTPTLSTSQSQPPQQPAISSLPVVPPAAADTHSVAKSDHDQPVSPLDSLCVYLAPSPARDVDKHAPLRAKALDLLARAGATAVPYATSHPNVIIVLRAPVATSAQSAIATAADAGVPVVSLDWLRACVAKGRVLDVEPMYAPPNWKRASVEPDASQSLIDVSITSRVFVGCRASLGPLSTRDSNQAGDVSHAMRAGRGHVLPLDAMGGVAAGVATHVVCAPDVRDGDRDLLDVAEKANPHMAAVTPFWVDSCVAARKLLSPDACVLFRPIAYATPLRDMVAKRVVVTLSGFQRTGERDWNRRRDVLSRLAVLLGAQYCERMRRKGTTHLVADGRVKGNSDKVAKAREWDIAVVGHDWLVACARAGRMVGVEGYPVSTEDAGDDGVERNVGAAGTQGVMQGPTQGVTQAGTQAGTQVVRSARRSTPRRSARLRRELEGAGEDGEGVGEGALKKKLFSEKLFTDFTAVLLKDRGDHEDSRAGAEEVDADAAVDVDEVLRRSRSASIDGHGDHDSRSKWSMDASQSQVIMHRDLTPPGTPTGTGKGVVTRAAKRARAR